MGMYNLSIFINLCFIQSCAFTIFFHSSNYITLYFIHTMACTIFLLTLISVLYTSWTCIIFYSHYDFINLCFIHIMYSLKIYHFFSTFLYFFMIILSLNLISGYQTYRALIVFIFIGDYHFSNFPMCILYVDIYLTYFTYSLYTSEEYIMMSIRIPIYMFYNDICTAIISLYISKCIH